MISHEIGHHIVEVFFTSKSGYNICSFGGIGDSEHRGSFQRYYGLDESEGVHTAEDEIKKVIEEHFSRARVRNISEILAELFALSFCSEGNNQSHWDNLVCIIDRLFPYDRPFPCDRSKQGEGFVSDERKLVNVNRKVSALLRLRASIAVRTAFVNWRPGFRKYGFAEYFVKDEESERMGLDYVNQVKSDVKDYGAAKKNWEEALSSLETLAAISGEVRSFLAALIKIQNCDGFIAGGGGEAEFADFRAFVNQKEDVTLYRKMSEIDRISNELMNLC